MSPEEIVAKFAEALELFEPIEGQPSIRDLTKISEVLTQLLLQIPFDETEGKDNLVGVINSTAKYRSRYGQSFVIPQRVGAYDESIADNANAAVRAKMEAKNRARRVDRSTYETARRETVHFILSVVEDTWVRELRDAIKFYTDVEPLALITHLRQHATGRHAFDMLYLMEQMRQYHLEHEVIPEYINALEDAQKMVALSNARNTIADGTLMLIASTSIHKPQRFPRANDKWDDLAKGSQTWSTLKVLYKDAHSKARINKIAPKGLLTYGSMLPADMRLTCYTSWNRCVSTIWNMRSYLNISTH